MDPVTYAKVIFFLIWGVVLMPIAIFCVFDYIVNGRKRPQEKQSPKVTVSAENYIDLTECTKKGARHKDMLDTLIGAILNRDVDFDSQRKTVKQMAEEYRTELTTDNNGSKDADIIQLFDRSPEQHKQRKM